MRPIRRPLLCLVIASGPTLAFASPALTARYDADGTRLSSGPDVYALRTVGVGRGGELGRSALTEWWTSTGAGMEQGWTVSQRPDGDGGLRLVVDVTGGDVVGDGDGAWLVGTAGSSVAIGEVTAYDRDGRLLSADLVGSATGFEIAVDDAGARYPITIDPVYSAPAVTLTGEAGGGGFGQVLAGAGDVNGDGYGDLIVAAPQYATQTGRAYVYLGSAGGLATTAQATLTPGSAGAGFGTAVTGLGDVNGDGFDDVAVGGPLYNASAGLVNVYLGSATGVSSTASTVITGPASYFDLGGGVAGVDLNRDGYADVVAGAWGADSEQGRVYIYPGSGAGVSATPVAVIYGHSGDFGLGYAVANAGDVNGDGYDDVVVGSLGGRAYVYDGTAGGVAATAATVLSSGGGDDFFGSAVAGLGDVNGDGYADIMVGDWSLGFVCLYQGSSAGVALAATLTGDAGPGFGIAVAGAGDVDGDGFDDVLVGGRPEAAPGDALLFAGAASGVSAFASVTLVGDSVDDEFGDGLAGAGDVNGDGYADIAVGAGSEGSTGRVYVYAGFADVDLDGDGLNASVDCDDTDATIGLPTTRYADADGDGYGNPAVAAVVCPSVAGYSADNTDCDDTNAGVNPGTPEVCDALNVDEDCNGLADDADPGATAKTRFYTDADGDTYAGTPWEYCDAPDASYVVDLADCNDADTSIHPGATDVPGDGIDQNCDGVDASAGDTGPKTGEGGCGCTSGGRGDVGAALIIGAALVVGRRRRR